MTTHRCPAAGCMRQLPTHLLFCRRHWALVPPALQADVMRTWEFGPLAEYWPARKAAVAAVDARLSKAVGPC